MRDSGPFTSKMKSFHAEALNERPTGEYAARRYIIFFFFFFLRQKYILKRSERRLSRHESAEARFKDRGQRIREGGLKRKDR